jgi:hypothetical protein
VRLWLVFPLMMSMLAPIWLERVYGPDGARSEEYVGIAEGGIGIPPGVTTMEGGIGIPPRQ